MKVWFQNRRIKWRKHHLEITQQRLAIIRQRQVPASANPNADEQMSNNAVNDKSTTSPALTDYESPVTTGIEISGAPDSELSICTDSMDSCSVQDVEEL